MMNGTFNRSWESSQHLRPGRLEADISWLMGMIGDQLRPSRLPQAGALAAAAVDRDAPAFRELRPAE